MLTRLIVFALCSSLLAAEPVLTIDLSNSSSQFPTNGVQVTGCNGAFDNPDKSPPASCLPYPIKIEIKGIKRITADDQTMVLEVEIANTSAQSVHLPRSLETVRGAGVEVFIAFVVYPLSGYSKVISQSLAFADTATPSSMVTIEAYQSVIYDIRFDNTLLQQLSKSDEIGSSRVRVAFSAYSVLNSVSGSGSVSAQRGNRILSKPFEVTK